MKSNIFILFLLLSCTSNTKDNSLASFHIIGKIDTSEEHKVFLKLQEEKKLIILDSTLLNNGEFEFRGSIKKPSVYGIFIDSLNGAIGLFMENSTIRIQVYKDSLETSTIKGSKTHHEYLNFIKQTKKITSKINLLFPEFQKARAENDVDRLNLINKKMQAINNDNTRFTLNYAKQHPNSYISAFALYSVLRIPTIEKDTISKIYINFSDYVKKGDYSKQTSLFLDK